MADPAFPQYVVLDLPNITGKSTFLGIFKGLSGLEVSFEVLEYREGGNNDFVHRLPGRVNYPNLVCSWGLVNDETLLQWFMKTHDQAQPQEMTLTLTAKQGDLTETARKFTFADAIPVRWSGPQLLSDNNNPQTWGETLEIAHSGLTLSS
jgi:phage tail-like protein